MLQYADVFRFHVSVFESIPPCGAPSMRHGAPPHARTHVPHRPPDRLFILRLDLLYYVVILDYPTASKGMSDNLVLMTCLGIIWMKSSTI